MFPDPADIPPPPTRKPLRLQRHDYSHPGPYFVTISTHDQQGTLSTVKSGVIILTAIGEIARAAWNSLPQRFQGLVLDACVIMPNHLHAILLLAPSIPAVNAKERTYSLPDIIGAFKSISTNQANLILKRRDQPIWHRSYHDHIIRNSDDLHNTQRYDRRKPHALANPKRRAKGRDLNTRRNAKPAPVVPGANTTSPQSRNVPFPVREGLVPSLASTRPRRNGKPLYSPVREGLAPSRASTRAQTHREAISIDEHNLAEPPARSQTTPFRNSSNL